MDSLLPPLLPRGARGNTVSSGDLDPRGDRRFLCRASALPGIGKQLLFLCDFPLLTVNSLPPPQPRWVTRARTTFVVRVCPPAGHGWLTANDAYADGLRHATYYPTTGRRDGYAATVFGGKKKLRAFIFKTFSQKKKKPGNRVCVFTRERNVRTWKIVVDNLRPISETAKPLVEKRRILQHHL